MATNKCSVDDCDCSVIARGWCSKHYNRWRKHGDPTALKKGERGAALSFIREARDADPQECRLLTFSLGSSGHGKVFYRRRYMGAHRIAYIEAYGEIPADMFVCHNCGVRNCVNPAHLRVDTPLANTLDRVHHATADPAIPTGSHKLSRDTVLEIVKSLETSRDLAHRFGVSDGAVLSIRAGRTWSWLTGIPKQERLDRGPRTR